MSDALYKLLRLFRLFFRYQVIGLSNLPRSGPSVMVANHAGNAGPVMLFFFLPLRFHPWVIADLTDRRRSPEYLLTQFVQPSLHLQGHLARAVAKLVSAITVPLLRSLGSVPVESHGPWTGAAFRRSLALLMRGRHLLIFPEDSERPADPDTRICEFKFGFVHLCQMYQERTGLPLPVVPIAVHLNRRTIVIGPVQHYHGDGYAEPEVANFANHLHSVIRSLYQYAPTHRSHTAGSSA